MLNAPPSSFPLPCFGRNWTESKIIQYPDLSCLVSNVQMCASCLSELYREQIQHAHLSSLVKNVQMYVSVSCLTELYRGRIQYSDLSCIVNHGHIFVSCLTGTVARRNNYYIHTYLVSFRMTVQMSVSCLAKSIQRRNNYSIHTYLVSLRLYRFVWSVCQKPLREK